MSELDELIGFLSDQRPPASAAVGHRCAPTLPPPCRNLLLPLPRRETIQVAASRTPALLQIAQHAAELVQGLTGSPEGVARLAGAASTLLPPLLRLVPGPSATSRAALVALVNLSQAGWAQGAACLGKANPSSKCHGVGIRPVELWRAMLPFRQN